jgi:hypothetical protein
MQVYRYCTTQSAIQLAILYLIYVFQTDQTDHIEQIP